MSRFLGIDLGTSSVKVVVIDVAEGSDSQAQHSKAQIIGMGSQQYPIDIRQSNWAEQDPQQWWQATVLAVQQALQAAQQHGSDAISSFSQISAIGLSGQMHGTVLIDANKQPIGSAIIWADQRSAQEAAEISAILKQHHLLSVVGGLPAAGFMGSTLRWLQKHDPARLEKTTVCLLPKDYIRLCLTGEIATDATDAAATSLFDVRARQWSQPVIAALNLPDHVWPPVFESSRVAGQLTAAAAEALGLHAGIPVVAGCADQPAQAIGNGLIDPGSGSITIGTGGQLFVPLSVLPSDPIASLYTFCHAPPDRWYVLGALLSAGMALRWLRDLLGMTEDRAAYEKLAALASQVSPGANGLLFFPYLAGSRLAATTVPGAFVGLTMQHDRAHLARAVMEGVAFGMREIIETTTNSIKAPDYLIASGGGLSGETWRHIMADVLGTPLRRSSGEERAAFGAAILSAIGIGFYTGYADAQQASHAPYSVTEPHANTVDFYTERYQQFLQVQRGFPHSV